MGVNDKHIVDYEQLLKHPYKQDQVDKLLPPMNANEKQIAGTHYKQYGDLQPWDVVTKWNLGYLDGTALKYIARWKDKGGLDDIRKAIHFLEKLLEVELEKENVKVTTKVSTERFPFPFPPEEKEKDGQKRTTGKAKKA